MVAEPIVEHDIALPAATPPVDISFTIHAFPLLSLCVVVLREPLLLVHLFGVLNASAREERPAQHGIRFSVMGHCKHRCTHPLQRLVKVHALPE